jgi:hypothetical protein
MEHIAGFKEANKQKHPKFVRWAVMIGIVILLNVFFVVVRGILFTPPQYTDFCPASTPLAENATSCTRDGGDWVPSGPAPASATTAKGAPVPEPSGGYCDYTSKCQKPLDAAQKTYETDSFALLVGLGLLALIIGILPLGSSIVSTGLSYGGVVAFVIASVGYWSDATQLIQLGISGLALGVLIYIGLKRFRD